MNEATTAIRSGNEIEKFDPSKLMDGVKDRIKSTFVSLIPDEMWDAMVEKEIYVFTTGRIRIEHETDWKTTDENGNHPIIVKEVRTPYSQKPLRDSWNRETGEDDISPLQKMIRDSLREKFRNDIAAYLDSDEYKTFFDENGREHIKKTLEDILVRNADTIFVNIIAGMMQSSVEQMKYNLQKSNY